MTHNEREELNALSLKVFGTSSKWKKLVEKGFYHHYDDTAEKVVPNTLTGRLEKQQFSVPKSVHIRHTNESVKALMEKILADRAPMPAITVTEPAQA